MMCYKALVMTNGMVVRSLLTSGATFLFLTLVWVVIISSLLEMPGNTLEADNHRLAATMCRRDVRHTAPGAVRLFQPESADRVVSLNRGRFEVDTAFTATPLFASQRVRARCEVQFVDVGRWRVLQVNLSHGNRP